MVEECWRTYPTWQVKTHEIVTPKMIRDVSEVGIESMRQKHTQFDDANYFKYNRIHYVRSLKYTVCT